MRSDQTLAKLKPDLSDGWIGPDATVDGDGAGTGSRPHGATLLGPTAAVSGANGGSLLGPAAELAFSVTPAPGYTAVGDTGAALALGPAASPSLHLSTTQAGAQITRDNLHWGSTLGAPQGPITFGFHISAPGYSVNGENVQGTFSPLSTAEQAAARAALALWASVANITFIDLGNTDNATIEFANYSSSTDNSEAFTFYPGDPSSGSPAGDVFINTYYASTTNDGPGTYEFMTFIHEIGHSLGLEHPGNYNAGPGQTITYQNNAAYIEDTRMFSLMSYFSEGFTGGSYSVYDETPMLDDIAAIQRLYTANTSTRSGDTIYGFHSNAGSPYLITSSTQHVVFTVWDGGGSNTFDFSGYSQSQTIDLNPEHFSSVGGDSKNVCIAQGVSIQNCIGGSGNDLIITNNQNDAIDGGAGVNTAVYSGNHTAYTFQQLSNGWVQASNASTGVTDLTKNIQYGQFNDGTFSIDSLLIQIPPVVTANLVEPENAAVPASSLFTVSNPGAVASYQFMQNAPNQTTGHFALGGVVQPAGQAITVAAANLSQVEFDTTFGTDVIWIRVSPDGQNWGTWQSFTLTALNPVPVITTANVVEPTNANIAASTLFSVANPVSSYQFMQNAPGQTTGHFTVSGAPQAAGQPVTVAAGNLSQLNFATTSGTDIIWVRATGDGHVWSAWQSFALSAPLPTVTTSNLTKFENVAVPASSLFSVSNPGGVVAYQLMQNAPNQTTGHFDVNGIVQSAGQPITVGAANLSQVHFDTTAGTDIVWVRISADGQNWGSWQGFSLTAADPLPVVVTANVVEPANSVISASSLFSASDPAGIASIQLMQNAPNQSSGHFEVAGIAKPAGAPITVTPASLSQVNFDTTTGRDVIWVRASANGTTWTDWQSFTLSTPGFAPASAPSPETFSQGQTSGSPVNAGAMVSEASHQTYIPYALPAVHGGSGIAATFGEEGATVADGRVPLLGVPGPFGVADRA